MDSKLLIIMILIWLQLVGNLARTRLGWSALGQSGSSGEVSASSQLGPSIALEWSGQPSQGHLARPYAGFAMRAGTEIADEAANLWNTGPCPESTPRDQL